MKKEGEDGKGAKKSDDPEVHFISTSSFLSATLYRSRIFSFETNCLSFRLLKSQMSLKNPPSWKRKKRRSTLLQGRRRKTRTQEMETKGRRRRLKTQARRRRRRTRPQRRRRTLLLRSRLKVRRARRIQRRTSLKVRQVFKLFYMVVSSFSFHVVLKVLLLFQLRREKMRRWTQVHQQRRRKVHRFKTKHTHTTQALGYESRAAAVS